MKKTLVFLVVVALLIATPGAFAQKDPHAGFGAQIIGPIDVNTLTSNNGGLGVVELNGDYYVSCRGKGAVTTAPHTVYIFDGAGKLKGNFQQTTSAATTSWGWRDGADDGKSLMFGYEGGIFVCDTKGVKVNSLITAKGPQNLISNPIAGPALATLTNYRGVAFNPAGNNGLGSIWVGNFGSDLLEIDLSGKVLTTHAIGLNPIAIQWSIYGLAWDKNTQTLWASSGPSNGALREINPKTGIYTGRVIERAAPSSAQGGLDSYQQGKITGLVGLDQETPDAFTVYRLDRYGFPGHTEALMLSSTNKGKLSVDSPKNFFSSGADIGFAFDTTMDPLLKNRPVLILINGMGDCLPNATNPFFPELAVTMPFSNPTGLMMIISGVLNPTKVAFKTPNFPFYKEGDGFRLQGLYLEPRAGGFNLIPTNQVKYFHANLVKIKAKAEGANSFNAVNTSGFWSVENINHLPILEITFDFKASSNTLHAASGCFDVDQTGMADATWFGNSKVAGSLGTYRNGCDTACGLIYDTANTYKNPHPDPSVTNVNCGFIASNVISGNSWQTLKFRFSSNPPTFLKGKKFEFDADIDGGAGYDGKGAAGVVVTIKLFNNQIIKGELKADPVKNMSQITW